MTALGVVQAVIIDQSVVNPDYRDFEGWRELWQPTYVPWLDLSAYAAVAFVLGHTVASFGAPLAIVSVISRDGARPWLGRWSAGALGLLYAAAAGIVLADHLSTEGWQLSGPQLAGAVVVVVALVVAALRWPAARRPAVPGATRWRPPPAALLVVAGLAVESALGWSIRWPALAATVVGLVALAVVLSRWGRHPAWTARHVFALAIGVLLSRALGGFLVEPVGGDRDVTTVLVNLTATALVGALAALGWYATRSRNHPVRDATGG